MAFNNKIKLVAYDPLWAKEFASIRSILFESLKDNILEIEHVGSTSIPNLIAKPILDIDIVINPTKSQLHSVIKILNQLGYKHVGDQGISGREAFKRTTEKVPISDINKTWMAHHLYVCQENSLAFLNHTTLRDYLLQHPNEAVDYGVLKTNLAKKFPHNMEAYVSGKTEFISSILNKKGFKDSDLRKISKENKAS